MYISASFLGPIVIFASISQVMGGHVFEVVPSGLPSVQYFVKIGPTIITWAYFPTRGYKYVMHAVNSARTTVGTVLSRDMKTNATITLQ